MWWRIFFLHSRIWGRIWDLNQAWVALVWYCLELLFTKKEKQWSSQMKLLGSFLAKRLPQNNCELVSLLSSLWGAHLGLLLLSSSASSPRVPPSSLPPLWRVPPAQRPLRRWVLPHPAGCLLVDWLPTERHSTDERLWINVLPSTTTWAAPHLRTPLAFAS
jgi:hypothetical protein